MHSKDFVIPDGIYLLSHSVGCMPAGTPGIIQENYLDTWSQLPEPWSEWLGAVGQFNAAVAELLHTRPEQVCSQVNLSSALSKILYGLPRDPKRNTLLISEADFPSLGFVFEQAKRSGFEIKFIPGNQDHHDLQTWKEALTDDVFLALVTHVQSNTGVKLGVREVTELARQRGVISVVDVAQSAGVVPIDVHNWSADFVLGGCVKWLCGGPGASYLWADKAILKLCEPVDVGWFSHAMPFEFDIHHFAYAPDAHRFLGGTPSVLPFVIAAHSIKQMLSIGIDEIAKHNNTLVEQLTNELTVGKIQSPRESELRSGTAIISFDDNEAVLHALRAAGVFVDARAMGLRISPHIYNSSDDIDMLVQILNQHKN